MQKCQPQRKQDTVLSQSAWRPPITLVTAVVCKGSFGQCDKPANVVTCVLSVAMRWQIDWLHWADPGCVILNSPDDHGRLVFNCTACNLTSIASKGDEASMGVSHVQ